ncbi:hypothetical protein BG004_006216 [Podila humilis]|nr:hypothetical protein BG004_006216 [Podila humilis]
MKFNVNSLLGVTSLSLIALSSVKAAALPIMAETPAVALEKREINGLNNYNCHLTTAHPYPVILVHATLLTADSWKDVVPALVKEGYCPFALTYGKFGPFQQFGGMGPIEDSAQELATFAKDVMARLSVPKVDIIGHSQGGILGRYWVKHLDGAGKVNKLVGVSAINHGTTLSNIVTIAKAIGMFNSGQELSDKIAPSFYQMVNTSPFIAKLNRDGDTVPGVISSNIATKFDEVVTPWESCFQKKAGVTNQVLQNLCMVSFNEHLTMVNSKVVIRWILNQLDPSTAKTANCFSLL